MIVKFTRRFYRGIFKGLIHSDLIYFKSKDLAAQWINLSKKNIDYELTIVEIKD